jgi:PST family polysaccharide transporter
MLRAMKWSALSELAARAIQPLVFLAVARFVSPEDFGVVAAALMVLHFSQILWEAGMSKTLVQRRRDIDEAASTMLWINLTLGILIAGAIALLAGPIATTLFHDPRVAPVLRVLSLQVVLGALSSVHIALLQKNLAFRQLFWVRTATVGLPGLASIPLAWKGMGYWALVAGALVGQLAQVVVLWSVSSWRPTWAFRRATARDMVRFGAWVQIAGLLSWFYAWGDSLVVGMLLGSHELGLYRTGGQFALAGFAMLLGPISPVLYSFLCRMNGEQAALRRAAKRILETLTLVTIPMGVIMFSLASPLSAAIFGARWQGVDLVIRAMAIMHGFTWVVGMNGDVYRASGKPAYESVVTAATLPIYLVTYLITARHGLDTFVWARLALGLMALFAHLAVLHHLVRTPFLPVLARMAWVALAVGIPSHFVVMGLSGRFANVWAQLLVMGTAVTLVTGGVVYTVGGKQKLREFLAMRRERGGEPA